MKLLIFEWGAGTYTYRDIIDSFQFNNIEFYTVSYTFDNINEDEFFVYRFERFLNECQYDAVFSINYFPLVAQCCHNKGISYISWSYDNPLNVVDIEDTLGYHENSVFLFDKIQVDGYLKKGFTNVYHMPLAVNPRRLDAIRLTTNDKKKFETDISFVGKLYQSDLQLYMSAMTDEVKKLINDVVDAQMNLHGKYIINDLLTDDFMELINNNFQIISQGTTFNLPKDALAYAMSAEATRKERLVLLKLLSEHFNLALYSDEQNEFLKRDIYRGTCGYYTDMPKVFKASKINLNINLKISQSGIPLRGMDIFGCGGFLLSTYQPEIDEYFRDGEGVVLFDSIQDAYYKAEYYLSHDDERIRIANRGREIALNNFTYDMQLEKIFKISKMI